MKNIKEKIEKKIWALLQKTETNGATKEEALSAMGKARELAEMYAINLNDVNAPMQGERMEVREVSIFKSGYDFMGIIYWLQTYFDVKVIIYGGTVLKVYGYGTDIDLFEYFYGFVCRAFLADMEGFKQSLEYSRLKRYSHGKTIAANFIKGYLREVSLKLKENYNERKEARTQTTALVLVEKEKQVQNFFNDQNKNTRLGTRQAGKLNGTDGYHAGRERGSALSLAQGIN